MFTPLQWRKCGICGTTPVPRAQPRHGCSTVCRWPRPGAVALDHIDSWHILHNLFRTMMIIRRSARSTLSPLPSPAPVRALIRSNIINTPPPPGINAAKLKFGQGKGQVALRDIKMHLITREKYCDRYSSPTLKQHE